VLFGAPDIALSQPARETASIARRRATQPTPAAAPYTGAVSQDDNATAAAVSAAEPGQVHAYPCPNCGASTALAPGTDSLRCGHCDHVVPIERSTAPIHEHDFQAALREAQRAPLDSFTRGGKEMQCKNCGARVVMTGQAQRCAFCDTAMVAEVTATASTIVPECLLPFALDQDSAGERYKIWLRRRWFAPNDLGRCARRGALDGVYLPYWTYDARTTTQYTGARGEHYYVTEHYTDSQGKRQTRSVRKTRWYAASGTVHVEFDDVLVCASTSLPRALIDGLEPWDLHDLRPFDGKFLAGFSAERYGVDLEDGFRIAEQRMEPRIRNAIARDIGGDEQRIHAMSVRHDQVRFKHMLLPLWISSFHYRDQLYRITVNARTGEVSGERPWSWIKLTLLVLLLAAIAIGLGYLYYLHA
jgi:ribosomal protein S27AE